MITTPSIIFGASAVDIHTSAVKDSMNHSYTLKEASSTVDGNNATCKKYMDGQAPFLLLVAVIENLIILICLPSLQTSRSSYTHKIVLLLSANDLFGCSVLLLSSIIDAATCVGIGHTTTCNLLGLFGFASMCWSIMIVVVISIDRCVMVHWPLFHRAHCRFSYLLGGSLAGFAVLASILMMPLLGVGEPYFYFDVNGFCGFSLVTKCGKLHLMLVAMIGVLLFISVLITIVCSLAMVYTLRKREKWLKHCATRGGSKGEVDVHDSNSNNNNNNKTSPTKRINETKHTTAFQRLTMAIAIINLILVMPFTIRVCIDVFLEKEHLDHIEDHITSALLFLSPVVNPVVYMAVNSLYRRHIRWCMYRAIKCLCPPLARRLVNNKESGIKWAGSKHRVTYNSNSNSGASVKSIQAAHNKQLNVAHADVSPATSTASTVITSVV